MGCDKDIQYRRRTSFLDEHIDQLRKDTRRAIAHNRFSISTAAKRAGVSRPVMDGFVHNDAYYPSTRIIVRFIEFTDRYFYQGQDGS